MAISSEALRQRLLANLTNRQTPSTVGGAFGDLGGSIATALQLRRDVPNLQATETADKIGEEVRLRDALAASGIDPGAAGSIASAPDALRGALIGLQPKPSQPPSALDVATFGLKRDELAEKKATRQQRASQKQLDRDQKAAENRSQRVPSVIRTLEALGIDPQSPEGVKLVTETLTKPQVQIGGKPPKGFRFKEPGDPMQGVEAIPGGPADRMSPEAAAKTQMVAQGVTDVQSARSMLFKPDGSIDRALLAQANIPGLGGAIPGTDGVLFRSLIFNALNAQLRAESGAAVPETEVERAIERFLPSPFDNPETTKSKLDRLEGLLGGTLQASGREAAPTTEATLPQPDALSTNALEASEPAIPATQEDFDALPSGAVFRDPGDGELYRKP